MTIYDAIKHLSARYKTSVDCYHTAITKGFYKAAAVHRRDMDVEQMAIDALREKAERENPALLTLEELRQLIDVPVYVSYPHNSNGEWIIFTYGDERGFETDGETWFEAKNYGKYWIAYRHKPRGD